MAKVELKQPVVQAIAEDIKDATSVVLVDYRGLTVAEDTALRKQLREAGVTYFVEKNTMLRIALKEAGLDDLCSVLEGTTAIAVCDHDQTAPARILGKFAEAHDDKFTLKAGYVDGVIYDAKGVEALSKIPSREVLLAQLVGSLQGPMQKLAATVKAVADKKAEEEAA